MIRRISLPDLSAIRDDSERRMPPGGGVILGLVAGGLFWGCAFGIWAWVIG